MDSLCVVALFVCFLPTTKTFFPTWGKIKLWNTKLKTPDWHPLPGKQVYLFNGFTNHSWLCNKIVKVETCSNNCTRLCIFFFFLSYYAPNSWERDWWKGPNLCWFNWQIKKKIMRNIVWNPSIIWNTLIFFLFKVFI